jgi:Uri superfamily endonuclease
LIHPFLRAILPGRFTELEVWLVPTGIYALVLHLPEERAVAVGWLGSVRFAAGSYLYMGSAMGPGGLAARLARHCRHEKKHHWHIDYLRDYADIEAIWCHMTDERLECHWVAAALALPGASVPVREFGSSDCSCRAHLVHLESSPDAATFARIAGIPQSQLEIVQCTK